MKVIIYFHSFIDVITNSSTELFCEITSEKFLPAIQLSLSHLLGRDIYLHEPDFDTNTKGNSSITFEIEYLEDQQITDDFCALLENYLINLVGKENFKLNRDVSY